MSLLWYHSWSFLSSDFSSPVQMYDVSYIHLKMEEWVKNIPSEQNREYMSCKRESIKVCTLSEQLSKNLSRDRDCCTRRDYHRTYFASGRNTAVLDKMPAIHQLFLLLITGRIPRGILPYMGSIGMCGTQVQAQRVRCLSGFDLK